MKKEKKHIEKIIYFILFTFCIYKTYKISLILKNYDFYLGLSIFITQLILLFSSITKNVLMTSISHYIFGLKLIILPYLTNNSDLLNLYILHASIQIIRRFIFKKCIIRNYEGDLNKKKITNNEFVNRFNWDNIPLLGILKSSVKIYNL